MLLVRAEHFTECSHRTINLLVCHDMEAPDKPDTAENVAAWFAGKSGTAPQASAHFTVDDNSIVRCLPDMDIAWAAPGANNDGLHYELAGYAKYGRKDWLGTHELEMLHIAAWHMAHRAKAYGIPIVKLGPRAIRQGARGLCGHRDVTAAFPELHGTHTDPGPDFPWTAYLDLVKHYRRQA